MRFCPLFVSLLLLFPLSILRSFPPAHAKVIISEVLYDAAQSPENSFEWVELYNDASSSATLSGWSLTDNTSTDTIPTATLSASAFLVVAASSSAFLSVYSNVSNVVGLSDGKIGNGLANSGDRLILKDQSGQIVDELSYGSNTMVMNPSIGTVGEGRSLERTSLASDTDMAADFRDQPIPSPGMGAVGSDKLGQADVQPAATSSASSESPSSPSATVSFPVQVFLSEFLPNPTTASAEWVEIYNADGEADLSGWWIDDIEGASNPFQIATGSAQAKIPPGGYRVYFFDRSILNNSGDTLRLIRSDGVVVETFVFTSTRKEIAYAKDSGGVWRETGTLTPGEPNMITDLVTSQSAPAAVATESALVLESSPSSFVGGAVLGERVSTVAAVKSLLSQTPVVVEGTVTAPPEILGERVMYIEDPSGGVRVKLDGKDYSHLKLGDSVRVDGLTDESRGESQIEVAPSTVTVLANGAPPTASTVRTNKVGEKTEGKLVEISGTVTKKSGRNFWVDDGTGGAKVTVTASTGITLPPLRKGKRVRVVGIVSQYGFLKNGEPNYRVLPRYLADIRVLPKTGGEVAPLGAGILFVFLGAGFKTGSGLLVGRRYKARPKARPCKGRKDGPLASRPRHFQRRRSF